MLSPSHALLTLLLSTAVARETTPGVAAADRSVLGAAHVASTTDSADAIAMVRAVFAAAERGDLAALDSLYAGDSLTVVEGAGINRGWADYRDHHLGPEVKVMKNFQYRPADIEVHVVGLTAWTTFRYTLKADMNGRSIDNVGRGTAILTRRGSAADGRWVIRHIQTSSRARRASDPASD